MSKQRYQIRQHWKNAEGKWVNVSGPIPNDYRLWYFIVDTHNFTPGWGDDVAFKSVEVSDCIEECNRLNEQERLIKIRKVSKYALTLISLVVITVWVVAYFVD